MGSSHKSKSTRARLARSVKPARKPRSPSGTKPAAPPARHRADGSVTNRGRTSSQLPDLNAILFAFCDAHALVSVAHSVVAESNHYGPEEHVLRLGVNALDLVYDRLDGADMQLARYCRKNHKASRGGS